MKLGPGHQPIPEDDLPKGWVASRIGDVCTTVQGGRIGLTKGDDYRSSGFPAYSAAGQDGFVDISEFAQEGVVLSAIGANCGRCFYASGQWTTLANVQAILPDTNRLSGRFLFHRANMDRFWPRSGSAQPFIKPSDVQKCWVAHPREVGEQSRIALVLDTVDEAIAKTEAVIAKLRQVRAGLLHDLLTRGLDPHGQLRDPIAHPEQFHASPLGQIPKEWTVETIQQLLSPASHSMRSGPFGSSLLKQELKLSGIPLLGIDNVHVERFVASYTRFVGEDKFQELEQYSVRPLDIMITIMGTVGRCCVVPEDIGTALSSKHAWTITLNQECYSPHLACWQLNHAEWALRQLRVDEQGGVMTAIRSETLRRLRLPVPTTKEKNLIEHILFTQTRGIEAEEAELAKLRQLKSGLMSDLLTGRVRVPATVALASASANGAPSNQPGATPQVTERKPRKG